MVEPHSSNFRVITTNILGVRILRKFTVLSVSLFFHFSQQFCQTKVIVKANTEWFPLVWPNWIRSFRPFRIHSKYLKETVIKRPLQLWKKLALALNVPIDICYKIFFTLLRSAKTKESRTMMKKIAHTKPTGENLPMAENTTCYAHIDWLLINITANVAQSNFL